MEAVDEPMGPISEKSTVVELGEGDGTAWAVYETNGPLTKVGIKHPELKEDYVLIDILHTGICHTDVMHIEGGFGPVPFPLVVGHEIVGRIKKAGKKVKDLSVGDIVGVGGIRDCCKNGTSSERHGSCYPCKEGNDNLCLTVSLPDKSTYGYHLGGYSTTIQLPYRKVFKVPKGLDISIAPPLMCAGATVFNPLKRWGKPGHKCAVIGIGGLGHLAIQFASKMGMKVYAVSTSEDKKEEAIKLGAHEYVVSTNKEQMARFHQEGIDLMIGTIPHSDITEYIKALKFGGGVYVVLGAEFMKPLKFNLFDLLMGERIITSGALASNKDTKEMLKFAAKHKVTVKAEKFTFDEFPKAFDRAQNGKPIFRCVVDVTSAHTK